MECYVKLWYFLNSQLKMQRLFLSISVKQGRTFSQQKQRSWPIHHQRQTKAEDFFLDKNR